MGLTAFAVFVIPWVLLAVFLTRSPSTLRLGTASAPWRSIPTHKEMARADRHALHPHGQRAGETDGVSGRDQRGRTDPPAGGALGTSVEPTEPDDKLS
ncbi:MULTISPECIES: hypothetical protein [unclassified Methylobacterium]|jgi:hypothetical protein|uniref:hypothetical protein n=1 Tax=unclassified Methylobacterium TaxID=2615210 RepID=UPI0007004DE7|nr:hypothetical protein [Methylobacterium sp. Leaf361]KQS75497.1 hypothetical protein ASG32_27460 [Methylobacterium sp. Leaf361]